VAFLGWVAAVSDHLPAIVAGASSLALLVRRVRDALMVIVAVVTLPCMIGLEPSRVVSGVRAAVRITLGVQLDVSSVDTKLGWLAAEILLKDGFKKDDYQPEEIGVGLANSNSSLDNDLKYVDTIKEFPSPAVFVYTLPNIVMGEICIRHNFKGENDFFIFEQFNAAFIQKYVWHLFETGALDACICGWVEIMDNDYKASLFLIEKKRTDKAIVFTEENITNIYQTTHG